MTRQPLKARLGKWSLRLCLAGIGLAVISVILFRLGLIGHWSALGGLALMGLLALLALLIAIIALIVGLGGDRRGNQTALIALVVALVAAYAPLTMARKLGSVPRINDISTDLVNPPVFIAVPDVRAASDNKLTLNRDRLATQQAFYTDLTGLDSALSPQAAFQRALDLTNARGWDVVTAKAADGHIEATAITAVLGFKDDIVIRIVAKDGGSRIDMRSASRLGRSDLGVNAARIQAFLADFAD